MYSMVESGDKSVAGSGYSEAAPYSQLSEDYLMGQEPVVAVYTASAKGGNRQSG